VSGEAPESGTGLPPTDPPAARVSNASTHVFISYASQDVAVADAIVEALERHGLKCWIAPRDVKAGALYADAIVRAISGAKAFVLVLSESAIASSHVGKEIERASSKKRPIIVLRIDAAPLIPALEYFLSESQWVEAQTGRMEAAYAKLIDDIRDPARTAPRSTPAAPLEVSAAIGRATHPKVLFNWIPVGAGIVFAVAAMLVYKFWISSHVAQENPVATTSPVPAAGAPAQHTISEKSVAVLPFVDMSEKKDQEYFSDGLSEQLIDMLTKVPDLRVPARTSSFYFKGKSEDIPTIARRLMVAHVLEGSIRKSGKHLRITAQLVRADNGYHLWSQTYDRQLDDIFKVQDEIAGAVVKALKVSLLEGSMPKAAGTRSTEAYTLFLQAHSIYLHASTPADREKVVDYLQRSLKLDGTFAPAWAFLSSMLSARAGLDDAPSAEGFEEARRAARQALALDPKLPNAHTAMAKIQLIHDWDWAGAQAEAKQALELDPGNDSALAWTGYVAWVLGDLEKTVEFLQKGVANDPLNANGYLNLGTALWDTGRLNDAQDAIRMALDLNPTVYGAHKLAGDVKLAKGDPVAALAEMNQESDEESRQHGRALVYHALGRRIDTDAALADLESRYATKAAYGIAEIHAVRGELDQAFGWLDRSYRQRDASCPWVKTSPRLKNLWPDPRFKAFLRKMNLPE
jgi:TolB-like protein/thioredoxin-like negative regulator of GroEL